MKCPPGNTWFLWIWWEIQWILPAPSRFFFEEESRPSATLRSTTKKKKHLWGSRAPAAKSCCPRAAPQAQLWLPAQTSTPPQLKPTGVLQVSSGRTSKAASFNFQRLCSVPDSPVLSKMSLQLHLESNSSACHPLRAWTSQPHPP